MSSAYSWFFVMARQHWRHTGGLNPKTLDNDICPYRLCQMESCISLTFYWPLSINPICFICPVCSICPICPVHLDNPEYPDQPEHPDHLLISFSKYALNLQIGKLVSRLFVRFILLYLATFLEQFRLRRENLGTLWKFMILLEYSVIQKSALIFQIYSPLQDLTINIDPLLLP